MASSSLLLDKVHRLGRAGDSGIRDGARMALAAIACATSRLSTIALLFTALTTVLLVWDLDHKERFLRVVFTPQSKSWLARGAFILIAYSGLGGVFWLAAVAGILAVTSAAAVADGAARIFRRRLHSISLRTMRRPRSVADAAAAGAFDRAGICCAELQCWRCCPQSWRRLGSDNLGSRESALWSSLMRCTCSLSPAKFMMPHATDNAALRGASDYAWSIQLWFWAGAICARRNSCRCCCCCWCRVSFVNVGIASALALPDFSIFEWCFVMAGQSVPNS